MMRKQGISGPRSEISPKAKKVSSDNVKVLLCEDAEGLGWLGDVVEVQAAYARNYLLPRKIGVIPTEANLRTLAEEKGRRAEQRKRDRERLEKTAAAVNGAEAVIAAKANEQGVLFGSVGKDEIAKNLREQGFEVTDEMVQLAENIKQVGSHSVAVKLAVDLTAAINVVVVASPAPLIPLEEGKGGEGAESLQETEQDSDGQRQ